LMMTLRYDPLGRRIEKASSTTTRYLYDQEDISEELEGTNALKARYTHGPGIDEPLAKRNVIGQSSYYEVDALGSISGTTNAAEHESPAFRYDSYGNPLVGEADFGYSFTGREWDPETKLYHYRSREYDPFVGTFLSEDPLTNQSII